MKNNGKTLTTKGGFLFQTYQDEGVRGCLKKIRAAITMGVPFYLFGRRTNKSVGAYFDLITEDARRFYGDNFHFGFFHSDASTHEEALAAHTDMVAQMAGLNETGVGTQRVLDIGCGICAPAIRIASRCPVDITGINISKEQVRQGRALVEEAKLADRIHVHEGNALELPFSDASFDSILCVEVAGDICVSHEQKTRLVSEMLRVLKPGGRVGFSDLIFTKAPTEEEESAMRAILYHEGRELITDWPAIFREGGFSVKSCVDMIEKTHPTWEQSIKVYEDRREEVEARFGKRIARATMEQMRQIPKILKTYGSFIVLSLEKPIKNSVR